MIIDDPLKPEDALSESLRGAFNSWYDSTLLSRFSNKEKGIIIVVQQWLHQDDLVGHLLEGGEEWEVLSFPAIAITDECFVYRNASGQYTFRRAIGDVLDPRRKSLETLRKIKELMGEYHFSAQYQQSPTPIDGSTVNPSG